MTIVIETEGYKPYITLELGVKTVETSQYYDSYYPMALKGGELHLPFQPLPRRDGETEKAIALLMTSQCSFEVIHGLTERLVAEARELQPDVIAGISSLGWILAPRVAEELGHDNWVPLTTTRKYWQDSSLTVPASSITSGGGKVLCLDQHIQGRVRDKIVAVVDDGTNTGGSASAAIEVLRKGGAREVYLLFVFTEGHDWEKRFVEIDFDWSTHLITLGHLPIFEKLNIDGKTLWAPISETM